MTLFTQTGLFFFILTLRQFEPSSQFSPKFFESISQYSIILLNLYFVFTISFFSYVFFFVTCIVYLIIFVFFFYFVIIFYPICILFCKHDFSLFIIYLFMISNDILYPMTLLTMIFLNSNLLMDILLWHLHFN